jgi:hypothetical protein
MRRRNRLLSLLLAIVLACAGRVQAASPVYFTAQWDSAISATIQWQQSSRACLYKETALHERGFIGCYGKVGTITIVLGGPQTDGAYRPMAGDVYILVMGGRQYRAPLIGRPVYLSVVRR